MGKKKNILTSMTAQEKNFMRKMEVILRHEGVPKDEMPEQKREALALFRVKRQKKCAKCVALVIDEMVGDK